MRFLLALFISVLMLSFPLHAQDYGFKFGEVTYRDMNMTSYSPDSTAKAVVLNEFGYAYFDVDNDYNLLLEYHVRIKILTEDGLAQANIEIPLRKIGSREEAIKSIEASSFSIEKSSIFETKVMNKDIISENTNKYWSFKKFAIPNVRVGSIIEYKYTLESPFVYNFRTWEFQSDIPKMRSDFWAKIQANYVYNISLKGFQNLTTREDEIVKDCFSFGTSKADCIRYKFGMTSIPAFVEEEYMTAKSNFLSTVNFELSEVKYFDGRVDKITKEWKDAEEELRQDEKFGIQLKRGKNILDEHINTISTEQSDPLTKAKKIYDFIRYWYSWNESYGIVSELGIKKAFDNKTGNVGDINLSLIAALRYAGLNVEPLILSTRENGLVTELYPVISDFNYVIAKVNIGEKCYLLDATNDYLSFGMIPQRCLNGKGRVLGEKGSYWYEIKPIDKYKTISTCDLKVCEDGKIRGTMQKTFYGYAALRMRVEMSEFQSQKEYVDDQNNKSKSLTIQKFEFQNIDDLEKPLTVKYEVEVDAFDDMSAKVLLYNPILLDKISENPFKSKERLFPVDFGAPVDNIFVMSLEYPPTWVLEEMPQKVGVALPNGGGRYIFDAKNTGDKLLINTSRQITRPVYNSTEYHFLKELYNQIIQVENTDLVFKRK